MVHYVFWLFSGGALASQPALGGGGGFQSLPATKPRLGAAPNTFSFIFTVRFHLRRQRRPKKSLDTDPLIHPIDNPIDTLPESYMCRPFT